MSYSYSDRREIANYIIIDLPPSSPFVAAERNECQREGFPLTV